MDTNTLFVTTEDGQEKQMEILFTFDSDEYGKSYVFSMTLRTKKVQYIPCHMMIRETCIRLKAKLNGK